MAQKKIVNITDSITVDELASALNLPVTTLIGELFKNGIVATINQRIDFETAVIIVEELGLEDVELKKKETNDVATHRINSRRQSSEDAEPRPPLGARSAAATRPGVCDAGRCAQPLIRLAQQPVRQRFGRNRWSWRRGGRTTIIVWNVFFSVHGVHWKLCSGLRVKSLC